MLLIMLSDRNARRTIHCNVCTSTALTLPIFFRSIGRSVGSTEAPRINLFCDSAPASPLNTDYLGEPGTDASVHIDIHYTSTRSIPHSAGITPASRTTRCDGSWHRLPPGGWKPPHWRQGTSEWQGPDLAGAATSIRHQDRQQTIAIHTPGRVGISWRHRSRRPSPAGIAGAGATGRIIRTA